jgi:hypothetical protein
MSQVECRNFKARCLDMETNAEIVEHEVTYEVKDSGVWIAKTVRMMATDPFHAVETVRRREGFV